MEPSAVLTNSGGLIQNHKFGREPSSLPGTQTAL